MHSVQIAITEKSHLLRVRLLGLQNTRAFLFSWGWKLIDENSAQHWTPVFYQRCAPKWHNDRARGSWGWHSGEKNTCLPPIGPGFDSGRVLIVDWFSYWFLPCCEGFISEYSGFLSPGKPTFPNPNSTRIDDLSEYQSGLRWFPLSLNIVIL